MPSTYKVTFFFEGPQSGWSENWYRSADNPQQLLENALAVGGYVETRREILSREHRLRYVRVCNIDTPRDAVFRSLQGDTGRGRLGTPGAGDDNWEGDSGAEQDFDAVNYRVFAGNTTWRSFLIRGLPSVAFRRDGTLRSAGPFQSKLPAFLNALKQYAILKRSYDTRELRATGVNIIDDRIARIDVTGPEFAIFVNGATIKVEGTYGISNLNGYYRIKIGPTANPGFIFVRPKQLKSFGTFGGVLNRVRLIIFTPSGITDAQVVGVTSRRTGRPSYRPRGRARVRQS